MNVLVLGGSVFVGRHIVHALLAAGHAVSVFNRGISACPWPAGVEQLRGDRGAGAAGLAALAGRDWDACIDVSGYRPQAVRASATLLRERVGRYVFVSAVMVYDDPREGPVDESFPVVAPAGDAVGDIDSETYGPLKVACERAALQSFGEGAAVLRPQVIVGPGDDWPRYSEWAARALRSRRGERFEAPGEGSDMLQVIDVRDVARFACTVVERGLAGTFNVAGPRLTWHHFVALLGVRDAAWMPQAAIGDAAAWPLYRPAGSPRAQLMNIDAGRALAAGLVLTDPAQTASDVLASLEREPV